MLKKSLIFGLLLSSTLWGKVPKKILQEVKSARDFCDNRQLYKEILLTCKGTIVYHERQEKKFFRFDRDVLNYEGRIPNFGNADSSSINKTNARYLVKTGDLTFYRVQGPVDGIKIPLNTCAEINMENIQRLCTRVMKRHCEDNQYDPSNPSSNRNGLCIVEKISTVNLSKLFPEI